MTPIRSHSDTPAKAWRDVRDGPPPAEYYQFARTVIHAAYERLVPPLKAIDVLMLSGMGLAARFYYPAVRCSGPPHDFEYGYMDVRAIHSILAADSRWAARAGLIWTPGREHQRNALATVFLAWLSDSLQSAIGGPWCATPDLSERGRLLKYQWQQIHRGFFKPDYAQMAKDLEDVVIDNVGGNEMDVSSREELPRDVQLGWCRFFAQRGGFDTTAFAFDSVELTLNKKAASGILASQVGKGDPLRTRLKSLDYEGEGEHGLTDVLENKRATQPEEDAAVQELRDLRDVRDLAASHPLLDKLAERAELDPDHARGLCHVLVRLVPLLEDLEDHALRAAIVYELGAHNQEGYGAWSRDEVGAAYGVTERQIEIRSEQAVQIVAGLLAA
jgi:hypothetical protein